MSDEASINLNPTQFSESIDSVIEHAIQGHVPESAVLNKYSNVITIGSCFAAKIRHFLGKVGLSSNSVWVPSGLNNTLAILDFLSWCVFGRDASRGFA